ncbi:MAG: right-handed parallel beta-helix repeat-containing protein [Patescibacteria group bacterium]|nr:right-handed parallel beta-helix repeat-containing protein [Patescibacteria group bacterium]
MKLGFVRKNLRRILVTLGAVMLVLVLYKLWRKVKDSPQVPKEKEVIEYTKHNDQSEFSPIEEKALALGDIFSGEDGGAYEGDLENRIRARSEEELQAAVDEAEPGARILIEPGEYRVNLKIERDLIMIGQGERTVLKSKEQSEEPVILALRSGLALKNLVLADSGLGLVGQDAKFEIERIEFDGLNRGAFFAGGGEFRIEDCLFRDSGYGIKTKGARGLIKNCLIKGNKKSGVFLQESKVDVIRNSIRDNGSYGLFVGRGCSGTIEGNFITDNKGHNVRKEETREIYK